MQTMSNAETLADDVKEYVALKSNSLKLQMVESLSLFSNDILSHLLLLLLIFMALLFFLIAVMLFFSLYVGPIFACLAVAALLLTAGVILYMNRRSMFVDMFVRCYCRRIFSDAGNISDEGAEDGK